MKLRIKNSSNKLRREDVEDALIVLKDWWVNSRTTIINGNLEEIFRKAVLKAKHEILNISEIVVHHDYGRRPDSKNPIIVMKIENYNKYIVLDGQHRIFTKREKGETSIEAVVVTMPIRYSNPTKKFLLDASGKTNIGDKMKIKITAEVKKAGVKGHRLYIQKSSERSRAEQSSTGYCPCGWEESHSTQDGVKVEFNLHLKDAQPITHCKECKALLPKHEPTCIFTKMLTPTFGVGTEVIYSFKDGSGMPAGDNIGVVTKESPNRVHVKFENGKVCWWWKDPNMKLRKLGEQK